MLKITKYLKKNFLLDNTGKSPAFFYKKKNLLVNKKIAKELIKFSKSNNNVNCRICLHKTKKNKLHNMIVLLNKKNKDYPHLHNHSDEIYQIMNGSIRVSTYNKKLKIKKTYLLNNKNTIFKVTKKDIHKVEPITQIAIFHEIKLRGYPFSMYFKRS